MSATFTRNSKAGLDAALDDTPVVVVVGPRQAGKSTLASLVAEERGARYVTLDDDAPREAAGDDPTGFIESSPLPLCIDEFQKAPALLPAIKAKVDRARAGAEAWITGARGDQTDVRREAGLIRFEKSRGLIKSSPMFDWTREQVLAFVAEHRVPINPLHAKGFASIGCAPCTRVLSPGEPERNGRWWWEQDSHRECGLHLPRQPYSNI